MNKQINDNYPTKYWHALADGRVCCDLCPQHCTLRENKRGSCFVRKHYKGEIVLTSYGRSSGFCIDPIEKKPLNHFYPGSSTLSFGTAGCNLSCHFCQNWNISKSRQQDLLCNQATPENLVSSAIKNQCQSLAFTYNDPVVFLEYAVDVATAAKERNIKTIAVTAGYICQQPREEFFAHIDAANVDLKGFTESFYQKLCHAQLQPVLETLLYLKHQTQTWLEITTLLIPGENDDEQQLHQMCQWLAECLGVETPLHFSAFHPDFKMLDKPATSLASLLRARDIALSYGLKYVYCGNIHHTDSDSTYCPQCNKRVIERDWYQIDQYKLDDTGHCLYCGARISGRFTKQVQRFGRQRIPIKI